MTKTMKALATTIGFAALAACGGATSTEGTTTTPAGGHACACEHREGGEACACNHEGADHACSCGAAAATEGAATTALVEPGMAQVGDRTRCPVNGEEFTVTENSPSVEHNGKRYFLCCSHCIGAFQANPAQYIGGEAAPAAN